MADLKFQPVRHDHKAFIEKASSREGFDEAYDALEVEYALASEMLGARTRVGLTQEAVAVRMGTTKSAISRLEAAGKYAPSVVSLKGCTLKVDLSLRCRSGGAENSQVKPRWGIKPECGKNSPVKRDFGFFELKEKCL